MPVKSAILFHTTDSHSCLTSTLLIILEGEIVTMRVDLSFGENRLKIEKSLIKKKKKEEKETTFISTATAANKF